MRIAIPVIESLIIKKADDAKEIVIFEIENNEILSCEVVMVPVSSLLPAILKEKNVDTFICFSMTSRLVIDLAMKDIHILGGVSGNARKAVENYLKGELEQEDLFLDCGTNECSGNCSSCH